jgi:uncharacterized delta-60 repeat protein
MNLCHIQTRCWIMPAAVAALGLLVGALMFSAHSWAQSVSASLEVSPPLASGTQFLHSGSSDFLSTTSATASAARSKDSPSLNRTTFREIGTWTASPPIIPLTLSTLGPIHVWLGLANSDDQGTLFDVRAQLLKNGAVVGSGEVKGIQGVTRNPASATEVTVSFGAVADRHFSFGDRLAVRILAKVADSGGHSTATAVRLYYDGIGRPARFALVFNNDLPPEKQSVDITNQFAIARAAPVLNPATSTYDSTVTLTNASGAPVLAPILAVVSGLPSGVTVANLAGQTADGKPYLSPMPAGTMLQPGATFSFVLKFADPQGVPFTGVVQIIYTVVVPPNAPNLIRAVATGATTAYLVGRVDGVANQAITLQTFSAATCVLGTLVGGTAGASITTTTDSSGYFGASVAGVNPGPFVTVQVTSPATSPTSPCLVSSRDNDSWPKAFPLEGSTPTARDFIDAPGKARWYKIGVAPGQRIDVKLSGLPADYDLAVFKDIGKAFASQFNPATAKASDLLKLTAEYAPSIFSPSIFSPSIFSPSIFSPDAYSPSIFSPSIFSPSIFSPSIFSPSIFSPSIFSPSIFSPSIFSPSIFSPSIFSPSIFSPSIFSTTEIAQAFSTAQSRSIVAVSATAGTSDESTVVNTWNSTGYFYIRVTGRGSAFNTSSPFTLSLTKGETTCVGVTDTTLTPRASVAPSGLKTVILTDSSKVALDAAIPGPSATTLRGKLVAFAARSEVSGVIVDVAGDARVTALKQQAANNPACPFAKNLVAEEIKGIVDAYRSNPLRYVVIAGNDDAIPFFRSPDQSAIGPESGYVPPVQSNSPSEASLRRDFVLSQDKYGSRTSLALPWNEFPVPELAVGRLIETAGEIAGLIDAYVAAGSVVSPHTSLVTGYDFLEDAANAVKGELDAGTGAAGDALITPNGTSPQSPASWTAAQLATKLLASRHDVIFLAGHFSANSALAADFATSLLTTDLAASTTDFTNSIVFSAGCHAGYNLVDGDAIPGVTLPLDWAQAFARKKATLIAGTGYQYGDTDFVEYSERLYNNFARTLRAGAGPVPVGEALVQAKLAYLAATPDIRGLHEKALLEATLFGLPMLGVNMPAGRGANPGTPGAINPAPVGAGPAGTLGLATFDLGVAPALTPHTQTLTNLQGGPAVTAAWFSGPDGVAAKPGEPALPLALVNVTSNDARFVLRGIGYRGGTYVDAGPMLPFTGAATTESRGVHVPFLSPVHYPGTMWTPNYFGALAGTGGTQLLVTPVQHRVASVSDGTSTQRRHTAMNLRLFYSANVSQAALSDAPVIVAVDAQPDAGGVAFSAQVVGDPAAAIHQVWVTYTGDGTNAWTSLDLSQCVAPLSAACGVSEDSRLWKGRLTSPPANIKYFVQAVSGVGLVARNDNFGAYFGIASVIPTATTLALLSSPASAVVGDSPAVSAKLTYAGGGVAGRIVAVGVGGAARLGTTGSDGSVTVNIPVVVDPGNYQITAAFAGDEVFQPSSSSSPFTINRAAVTPTVLPAGGATAGINISGALGGSPAGLQQVPVTFTLTGPGGTTTASSITDYLGNAIFPPPSGLPPGNYTVTQASYGGDGTYAPTTITFPTPIQITVPKLNQSITFDAIANRILGDPDFTLFAPASSGLAVSFGASGACTVAGSNVHLTGGGDCTITADQAGDATYNAAATVMRSFTIATPPTVLSLARVVPNPTMADTVTYTVTFSEVVNGVAASNFALVTSGISGASIAGTSGSGATRTVSVSTGRGTGTLRVDLVNGTGITNIPGTSLSGATVAGETYRIDKGGTVIGGGEGQLVTGFGTGGFALFTGAQIATVPGRIRVLGDGRILAVGGVGCADNINPNNPPAGYCTLQIAQYLASGAPDASFGTSGRVVTAVTNIGPEGNFTRNGDGTLLVRGVRFNGTNDVPFAAKFTSAGAPDPSFGTNGLVTLDSLPQAIAPSGSVVDASGRVVIVGTTLDTGAGEREDIFVTRLTTSGATDTTFGNNGVAQFALSAVDNRSDRGTTIDVQPDGKLVVGGRTKVTSGLGYDFLLMRLDANGAPDPSFGTNGVATTRFQGPTSINFGRKLVLQPDGKIVLVGGVALSGGAVDQCGIARFDANGALDPGFGTGGRVLVPMSLGCFNANQQTDGKLVITGNDQVGDVTYGTFVRLLLSGALDTAFGNAGRLQISNFDTPTRVAFTSSGNIVTGLTIQDPADGVRKSYVVELTTTLTGPWVGQSITFNALPDATYGDVFTVSATPSSGLPVSFAVSGVCSVAGNFVQLTGVGNCTITASQSGNATFFAATPVAQTFAVATASQAITFAPAPTGVTVGQPLVISATSGSSTAPSTIPIVFSSQTPGVCTTSGINGANLTLVGAGQCTIAASQAGDGNYVATSPTTQSFMVSTPATPPNTYLVANVNDSGAGSLRDAIAQANAHAGPDIVDLSGLSGTILLTTGPIQIKDALQIVGPGADVLTIDGNANRRIFSISVSFPSCPAPDGLDYLVSISGLRLTNGKENFADSSGGAIWTEHSLALDSVIVDNSIARSGGGVAFWAQYPGQTLTITNSQFLDNTARDGAPALISSNAAGGGLAFQDKCTGPVNTIGDLPTVTPVTVTIANSEFRNNTSQPVSLGGRGGAIRSYSLADITISDTRIVDNHVDAPNPPVAGKIYHGGGIDATAKSLRIERSEIAENDAVDVTSGDVTRSGGLHLYKEGVNRQGPADTMAVKIINSTISGNASSATAGAMLAFGNVALELDNSTVSDNLAALTRTGGIIMSSGDTYPVSGSNTSRPTLKLVSSILANDSSSAGDLATSTATIPSFAINASNSLIEKYCSTCNLSVSGTGNLVPVGATPGPDPVLGPLAFNGGTTRTHALLAGSPAIDTGSNPLGLTTDQRSATNSPRLVGAAVDMGAYEVISTAPFTAYADLSQFGSLGTGNGQFNFLRGIAIDPISHNLVVGDTQNNRVQIFNSAGVYLSQFGSLGAGNGQFNRPFSVAIDPTSQNVVVTEHGNNRVQIFSSAGAYLSQFGTLGAGDAQFNLPTGVAIDPTSHNIVVADSNNNRVQIFSSAGVYLSQFGTFGAGSGQFNLPYGVAIDPTSHNIVVADSQNNRVQIFSSAGLYLSQFGTLGTGNGQFQFSRGVAIDPTSHNIVVADYGNIRVQIFSSAGAYLSQFGIIGVGLGGVPTLGDVAIDPTSHDIVVTDIVNHRVQIFAPQ